MGTTISGQTHATAPISRTARVPLSGSTTATPPQVAATWSPVVISLSAMGFISDASGGLAYGATAPSGSGQESAINTAVATAYAAVSDSAGLMIVNDLALATSGPIYAPGSNFRWFTPTKGCGIILRSGTTGAPLFRSFGTNLNMTVAANTQNTFGKYDPSPPGGQTATNYRVFDPAFVASSRLQIQGGTWNGNSPQQGGTTFTTAYGAGAVIQIFGVDGVQVDDVDLISSTTYNLHFCNCRNVEYDRILIDSTSSVTFTDGVHFNGPCVGIRGGHARTHVGDDNIAFNADDVPSSGVISVGINYPCGGDITDGVVEGPDIWNGSENATPKGSVRILSSFHRVDNITIKHTIGQTSVWSFRIASYTSLLCPGNGNVGRVLVYDHVEDTASANNGCNISLGGESVACSIELFQLRGRYRYNATAYPDIEVAGLCTVAKVDIEWIGYQPAGALNNTQPALLVAGTVGELKFRGSLTSDSSITTRAAPFLRTATGANITLADLDVHGDAITNLVDHAAGVIGTLKLAGVHSNAGGGSPLAIATGLTITNYILGSGAFPLAYVAANGAKSGSGTITNTNSYSGP